MADIPKKGPHDLIKTIEELDVHGPLCLIHETREELLSSAILFIKVGRERGETCMQSRRGNRRHRRVYHAALP